LDDLESFAFKERTRETKKRGTRRRKVRKVKKHPAERKKKAQTSLSEPGEAWYREKREVGGVEKGRVGWPQRQQEENRSWRKGAHRSVPLRWEKAGTPEEDRLGGK